MVTAEGSLEGAARSRLHVRNKLPNNCLILQLMPCKTFTACEVLVVGVTLTSPLWAVALSGRRSNTVCSKCEVCEQF